MLGSMPLQADRFIHAVSKIGCSTCTKLRTSDMDIIHGAVRLSEALRPCSLPWWIMRWTALTEMPTASAAC